MQPATAAPRSGLSPSAVLSLVANSPSVQLKAGVERYDASLSLVGDLSDNLQPGSSVSSDCLATIHRSCTLVLDADAPFDYLSDYLKPYVVMTDNATGFTARFNLGVYTMTSPTPDLTLAPGRSAYTGYDLLQILNQPLTDTFFIPVGSDPVAVAKALILAACPHAAVSAVAYTGTLTPVVYVWPIIQSGWYEIPGWTATVGQPGQETYLSVVNDLLALAGYLGVWVDWDGVFQLGPYTDPNAAGVAPEWTFDLSTPAGSVVSESRSALLDVFNTPNTWVYIMNNQTVVPVEGSTQFTFVDNFSAGTSVAARGRVIKKVVFVDAVDYPTLVTLAVQGIEADLFGSESFAISAWPIPLFWHRDLVQYIDPVLATLGPLYNGVRRVMVQNWTLPLDTGSGDMPLTLLSTTSATSAALAR